MVIGGDGGDSGGRGRDWGEVHAGYVLLLNVRAELVGLAFCFITDLHITHFPLYRSNYVTITKK